MARRHRTASSPDGLMEVAASADGTKMALPTKSVPSVDLRLVTIGADGRLSIRRAAGAMGWVPGRRITFTAHAGLLRLADESNPVAPDLSGIQVTLNDDYRIRLPGGLINSDHAPGTRVVLLTAAAERVVALIPLPHIEDRLDGQR